MEFSVNAEEVSKGIQKLIEQQLPEAIKQALQESCQVVEAQAKINAPVDSGQLVQSIKHKVDGNIGTIYSDCDYSPYIHTGTGLLSSMGNGRKEVPWHYKDSRGQWHTTSGQKPQPFLEDAMTQSKADIEDIFRSYFK